jgi:heat shock protein HtpX
MDVIAKLKASLGPLLERQRAPADAWRGQHPLLGEVLLAAHDDANRRDALVLAGGLAALLLVALTMLTGWWTLALTPVGLFALYLIGPGLPAASTMQLYGASRVTAANGAAFLGMLDELGERAGLVSRPELHVIPSATLAAFTAGDAARPAIAVTEGLVRKLTLPELAGVLAHEVAHIRNGDLWTLAVADGLTRLSRVLSFLGLVLAVFNIPSLVTGLPGASWLAIGLLAGSPLFASAAQLTLKREREHLADETAAALIGGKGELIRTIAKLETYAGTWLEDVLFPMRRLPFPSLLRSHPSSEARIARLDETLMPPPVWPPVRIDQGPLITALAGYGTSGMQPRYRWGSGVWY